MIAADFECAKGVALYPDVADVLSECYSLSYNSSILSRVWFFIWRQRTEQLHFIKG
jgi:hypothetical protein